MTDTEGLTTSRELSERCRGDGEFRMAARYWTGGLRLVTVDEGGAGDGTVTGVTVTDGEIDEGVPEPGPGVITLSASAETWAAMTQAVPPRFLNDISPALGAGLSRRCEELTWWRYSPAAQRAVELMRPAVPTEAMAVAPAATAARGTRFDGPVGRYVHVDLGEGDDLHDHRVYFEEAGDGIPLLLQHTAGSHGAQWRHLFERPELTDRFRLIAYDLPFHGKSVPPTGREWWQDEYRLTGGFLRSVPRALSAALGLDRPVFMGCSVGGLLALDLAASHPDEFRAVISVEGSLHVGGDLSRLSGFWHPGVSNESKARMMEGLTSPTSPAALRKETTQTYASGWPPAFIGDLYYYSVDYDLRDRAAAIDTEQVGVHIMSGEYDYSATLEDGRAAHEAIAGSTFTEMMGVGHFPMSENPEAFVQHLLPILDKIA